MRQDSFSDAGFEKYRKKARKEQFLEEMETILPWKELTAAIKPSYPTPEGAGRRSIDTERMLRIHFIQHWFNLSDLAAVDALYDSRSLRHFVGIDLGREPVPVETAICKFRHLMEKHNLGDQLFHLVNQYLQENGLKVSRGTRVDTCTISAPSSTKNKQKERDPETRQTRKSYQWYFRMKAHIGVDSKTKLIHSVVATSANVHDFQVLPDLLHGEETRVWGDSGYTGQKQVIAANASRARDFAEAKGSSSRNLTDEERARNRNKSGVRAKVEHQFSIIKRQCGFPKVRYRGLDKNAYGLFGACALSNLVVAK